MRLHAERLYVRCPNWVGDFVMSTPILQSIRDAFPDSKITLGLRPHLEPILRGLRFFDELHFHPPKLRFGGVRKLASELKEKKFDAAILFPNSFETALVAALAGIPRRIGYAMNGRGFLLTDYLRPPMRGFRRIPNPMPYFWTDLVGLAGVEVRSIRPKLDLDMETESAFASWLLQKGIGPRDKMALIAPGASFGSSKLWRPDRFARAIDLLAERAGTKALIQFGPAEESIARTLKDHCKSFAVLAADPPLDLHRLKAAAKRCNLLICTDSGVRHYGVAFDRPVVCVMGPNDPRFTAANLDKTIVVREDVDCGPCQLKACPLDHKCMERIDPARVADAAMRLLDLSLT
ncbi:MAG: lipopolysaccharide heptosyltransferase II [Planctomycetes bacterium]|nr:lipopolysaccharide heptosyltransferase II [Planctomycetota bacterium]